MGVKIAAIQLDIVYRDPEENRRRARMFIEKTAERHPDIIFLPETWTTGYSEEVFRNIGLYAESDDGPSVSLLRRLAQKYGVWIVGGSIPEKSGGEIFNTIFLINREGNIHGRYRKMHLYSAMAEDKGFSHGREMPVFDTEFGKLALMTCYDIRFTELSRTYAVDGAELIAIVSNFPKPKLNHWRVLIQARAIENQLFVVACNRVGNAGTCGYFGHSIAVDPWGEIVAEEMEDESVLWAELDMNAVGKVRGTIPMYADRRPASYPDHILRQE
jgi:predicted amidohydrolase